MATGKIANQGKIIKEIKKIEENFKQKLDALRLRRDKAIGKVLDDFEQEQIRKAINK